MADRMRESSADVFASLLLVAVGVRVGVELEAQVETFAVDFDAGTDDFGVVDVFETWPVRDDDGDAVDLLLIADVSPAAAVAVAVPIPRLSSASSDNAANRLSNSSPVPAAAQNFIYRSTILS